MTTTVPISQVSGKARAAAASADKNGNQLFGGTVGAANVPLPGGIADEQMASLPPQRLIAGDPGAVRPANARDRPSARPTDTWIGVQIASTALDDRGLSEVRGGFDTGSGVELSFAFQQATFLNHNLVQTIVVPTITVARNASSLGAPPVVTVASGNALNAAPATSAAVPTTTAASPSSGVDVASSLAGLGMIGRGPGAATAAGTTTTINNGTVQRVVSSPGPEIQSIVNNGLSSVFTTLGGGGLTNVITNTANNQLLQQVVTIDIGIQGLSQVLQQGIPSTVLNRLAPANAQFR